MTVIVDKVNGRWVYRCPHCDQPMFWTGQRYECLCQRFRYSLEVKS